MDIRKINTKNKIKEGIINLLADKKLADCTIDEIVQEAAVSKKSFYNYFKSKGALVASIEDDLIRELKQCLVKDRAGLSQLDRLGTVQENSTSVVASFKEAAAFCDRHKQALAALLSDNGDISFQRALEKVAGQEFDVRVAYVMTGDRHPKAGLVKRIDYQLAKTNYITSVINILTVWLKNYQAMSLNDFKAAVGRVQSTAPWELVRSSILNH